MLRLLIFILIFMLAKRLFFLIKGVMRETGDQSGKNRMSHGGRQRKQKSSQYEGEYVDYEEVE